MSAQRLKLGMVGGGEGAFIGAVHRMAARLDGQWDLVAGAFQSNAERSIAFGRSLGLDEARCYGDFATMAKAEAARADRIDAVAIVTPNHMHHPVAVAFLDAGVPVICDKPMTISKAEADDLAARARKSGLPFVLTHNYSGYPMIRHARAMVAAGDLGRLRVVQVQYAQDWLATDLSGNGQAANKQAEWRGDPSRAGPGGALGDIATHAFQLTEFVAGDRVASVAAELSSFVPGRRVDDNVQMMLRFSGGASGALWASQVAAGEANNLVLRIYGERGGLDWRQENPDLLRFMPLGEPPRILRRGGPSLGPAAAHATRIPGGHPEGYLEGFAQIYADAAELIRAHKKKRQPAAQASLVPGLTDGVRSLAFIESVIASHARNGAWVHIAED